MAIISHRSRNLTRYLEVLVESIVLSFEQDSSRCSKLNHTWTMITPRDPQQRGAMLSFRWHDADMLDRVVQRLKAAYVIVDIRKPDIMRITPSPLYTSFEDVWKFGEEVKKALEDELSSNMIGNDEDGLFVLAHEAFGS
jgi:kynureninase